MCHKIPNEAPLPPPLPPVKEQVPVASRPCPPVVPPAGPPGAFLVELITYSGHPYNDHWAYFIRSDHCPDVGVMIDAVGDVSQGFDLEIKRNHDLREETPHATERIALEWVDGKYFDKAVMSDGRTNHKPAGEFEISACKVPAPVKSLNSVASKDYPRRRVQQRNCQTWIIESAAQLVQDGMFSEPTAAFLREASQV